MATAPRMLPTLVPLLDVPLTTRLSLMHKRSALTAPVAAAAGAP